MDAICFARIKIDFASGQFVLIARPDSVRTNPAQMYRVRSKCTEKRWVSSEEDLGKGD